MLVTLDTQQDYYIIIKHLYFFLHIYDIVNTLYVNFKYSNTLLSTYLVFKMRVGTERHRCAKIMCNILIKHIYGQNNKLYGSKAQTAKFISLFAASKTDVIPT